MNSKNFETNYKLDLKTYREFNDGYLKSKKLIRISMILVILACIINLFIENYLIVINLSTFFIFFIIFYTLFSKNNANYKRMIEAHGGEIPNNKITINDDGIIGKNLNNQNITTYKYEQVIGIIETKNLVILKLKYNLGIIIDKNNLIGDKKELIKYLFDKCPNIKRKKVSKIGFVKVLNILFFISLIILLVLGTIFDLKKDRFIDDITSKLRVNRYNVYKEYDYYLGKKTNVYNISKNNNIIGYIYTFDDYDDASSLFDKFYNEFENEPDCKNDDEYRNCLTLEKDNYINIIINDRFVFYGLANKENKDELFKMLDAIDYLK